MSEYFSPTTITTRSTFIFTFTYSHSPPHSYFSLSLSLSLCWTNTSLQQRSPNFGSPLLNLSLTLFQTKSLFYFNIVQIIHIYYPIPFVEASCICFGKLNHKALCGKNSVYEATGLKKKKKQSGNRTVFVFVFLVYFILFFWGSLLLLVFIFCLPSLFSENILFLFEIFTLSNFPFCLIYFLSATFFKFSISRLFSFCFTLSLSFLVSWLIYSMETKNFT